MRRGLIEHVALLMRWVPLLGDYQRLPQPCGCHRKHVNIRQAQANAQCRQKQACTTNPMDVARWKLELSKHGERQADTSVCYPMFPKFTPEAAHSQPLHLGTLWKHWLAKGWLPPAPTTGTRKQEGAN